MEGNSLEHFILSAFVPREKKYRVSSKRPCEDVQYGALDSAPAPQLLLVFQDHYSKLKGFGDQSSICISSSFQSLFTPLLQQQQQESAFKEQHKPTITSFFFPPCPTFLLSNETLTPSVLLFFREARTQTDWCVSLSNNTSIAPVFISEMRCVCVLSWQSDRPVSMKVWFCPILVNGRESL